VGLIGSETYIPFASGFDNQVAIYKERLVQPVDAVIAYGSERKRLK
jgi:hypothetical protein